MTTEHRDDQREQNRDYRYPRMLASMGILGAGALLARGDLDNLTFFGVGVVLFLVGFLAYRVPQLFWTPVRRRRSERERATSGQTATQPVTST